MKFIGSYNKSIFITFFSIFLSIYAIICNVDIKIKMLVLIIVGICDLFDGVVARKCKRTELDEKFGIQLDSFADLINFGIYPCFIYTYIVEINLISVSVSMLYIFCTVQRLGYFNITTEENEGIFKGLPTTYSALVITTFYVIVSIINNITGWYTDIVYSLLFICIAFAFICNFEIKKPKGKMYIIFSIIAIIMTILIFIV